jgi:hypothetical protein
MNRLEIGIVWPDGSPAVGGVSGAQRTALGNVAERWNLGNVVTIHPMFGGDGCVLVNVGSLWLGVETDGYTHS